MSFDAGTSGYSSAYTGDLRVEGGTLKLATPTVLPSGASLTVENRATLDLNGQDFSSVTNVTLNGGGSSPSKIINGTIVASGSYDVSSGTISAILEGTAALNKRTTGTVTLDPPTGSNNSYSGGTFIDVPGTLSGNIPNQTPPGTLYWVPGGSLSGGSGAWDGANWSASSTSIVDVPWHDGDVAVFSGTPTGTSTIAIAGQISPSKIEFDADGYDLEDDGSGTAQLMIRSSGMAVTVPTAGTQATIGCEILDDANTGEHSLTKEGLGMLILGTAAQTNTNSYTGGTFIDAGTVQAGNAYAGPGSDRNYKLSGLQGIGTHGNL